MRRFRGIGSSLGTFACVTALVVVLAACGSSSTNTPSSSSSSTATAAPTTAAATTAASPSSAASPSASSSSSYGSYPGYGSSTASSTSTTSSAASTPARGTAALQVVTNASLGKILADSAGFTLYAFSKDTSTTSACTGTCAVNWPPLTVSGGTSASLPSGTPGTLGTLTRTDGSTQVTYNGHPLYYFKGDTTAGTANGNGLLSGAWKVVAPAAS